MDPIADVDLAVIGRDAQDGAGRQDQATKTINSVALSAGGGGGTLAPGELLALACGAMLALLRRRRGSARDERP